MLKHLHFALCNKRLSVRQFPSNFKSIRNMGSSFSQTASNGQSIVKPVESTPVDTSKDPSSRRLTFLLRANHINHSTNFHHEQFHNHMVHILGSAFLFGATPEQLNDIYDEESRTLVPWEDSPSEIGPHDWKAHFGDKKYARAYLDFFEDEMVQKNYDWKATVMHFLLDGDQPLLNGLVDGVGHPLIHLAYAFELENREVAMEALEVAATNYDSLHQFIDEPNPPTPYITYPDIFHLLTNLREDDRYDGKFDHAGIDNMEDKLLGELVMLTWERINSLIIGKSKEELATMFENQVDASVLAVITGHKKGDPQVILPLLNEKQAWHIIRSHVVLTVLVYLSQCRPLIKRELLEEVDVEGKDWDYIKKKALEGDAKFDAHYVKALRALLEFEKLFGNKDNFYLKAAVKFADEFQHWTGFAAGNAELDIRK